MKSAFAFLPAWPLAPGLAFWAGVALLAAGLCGEFCWRVWRVPRITGYAVIGLLAGSAGFGVLGPELMGMVRPLMELGLGLLMFELGSRLNLGWIRRNPWLIVSSLAESALTLIAVFGALRLLGVAPMSATILAAIAIGTSPAMVIQLRTELRAEGQVTQRLLTLATLNSFFSIVVVRLASAWLHQTYYDNVFATVIQPLYSLAGSLLLAYLLARGCNLLYRRIDMQDEHSFVALVGAVILAIAIAQLCSLSTVMALLAAGIIFRNLDQRPQLWPAHFGTAGWLLTVMLFVLTLIPFSWRYVPLGAFAALVLIAARLIAKLVGVMAFAAPSGIDLRQGAALGVSLMPMSALAYLLMDDTYKLYPDFDPALRAIVLCAIVMLQIAGPLVVYFCLSRVRERRQ